MAIVLVDGVQCRHHSSETAAEDQQSRHFSISLRGSARLHAVLEPLSASGDGASRLLSSKLICDVCQRSLCERLPHAPFPFQHHRMNCADATLRRLCFGWLDQNAPVANLATLEQRLSAFQGVGHVQYGDRACRASEAIAAIHALRGGNQPGLLELSEQLRDIGGRDTLKLGKVPTARPNALWRVDEVQQAVQAVFDAGAIEAHTNSDKFSRRFD